MELWAWLGAYLVAFVLLQVYLYRYFTNQTSATDPDPPASLSNGGPTAVDGGGASQGATRRNGDRSDNPLDRSDPGLPDGLTREDTVQCQCGAFNRQDQMFVYCRHCGERLDA